MDTNTGLGMMDLIILGGGLYILYAVWLLVSKGEVKPGLLVTRDCNTKKCKDLEAYKKYVLPPALTAAVCCILSGALGLYQTYVSPINKIVYGVTYVVFLAGIVWFAVAAKKGQKKFF